jgi:hypothetical protein
MVHRIALNSSVAAGWVTVRVADNPSTLGQGASITMGAPTIKLQVQTSFGD